MATGLISFANSRICRKSISGLPRTQVSAPYSQANSFCSNYTPQTTSSLAVASLLTQIQCRVPWLGKLLARPMARARLPRCGPALPNTGRSSLTNAAIFLLAVAFSPSHFSLIERGGSLCQKLFPQHRNVQRLFHFGRRRSTALGSGTGFPHGHCQSILGV